MSDPQGASEPRRLAFRNIGVLYHPKLAESRVMAAEMLEYIEGLGASAWVRSSWNEEEIKEHLTELDLFITLGGDGSLLRAARLTAHHNIPILGINMGRLGFLAEVQPAEWPDLISAHGTATLYNDEMESIALSRAGLSTVPVNSLKGNFGHTLGAAGLVEGGINTEAMRRGMMPGTKGFSEPGVSRPIDVISTSRRKEVRHMLKVASGFGGCNASILFRRNR